ncbi:MAG: archaeal preflagellin peptidase FlaK [Candidatus Diapherotrites archaeon]|nr:archaeal preflagellin peptidase FlaK [Candidatus Diapherotrites archaeon]MDN5367275.1 archaeal preflagellin peptidase FlaK [Candidatus Diapherotrites archaeon]
MVHFVSVLALFIAAIFDIRERRIPDWLTYSGTMIGIILWLLQGDYSVLLYVSVTLLLAYLFYRMGLWAGGDVKLFTALASLNPYSVSLFGVSVPFPLALFLASLFSAFFLTVPYLLYRVLVDRDLRTDFLRSLRPIVAKSFVLSVLAPVFGVFALLFTFLPFPGDVLSAIAVLLYSPSAGFIKAFLVLFILSSSFKLLSMRSRVFRRVKRVEELREGDVPVDFVLEDGRIVPFSWATAALVETGRIRVRINPLRAAGLYREDIKWLKEIGVNELPVKTTMPFVPFVLIAYILLLPIVLVGG